MKTEEHMPDKLEHLASRIPVPPLDPQVWTNITQNLYQANAAPLKKRQAESLSWMNLLPGLWMRLGHAALVFAIVTGVAVSWYYLGMNTPEHGNVEVFAFEQRAALESAGDDLDLAIFYYERAIAKLERAISPPAGMKPEQAVMYNRKIRSLKESIQECKEMLKLNRDNQNVQDALFTSYLELRQTLQQLSPKQQTPSI